ncbi:MAG: tRNA pseudouridine32 synthase/23S rRNA pseudouridine746 synthase [Halieaceae bacterium]
MSAHEFDQEPRYRVPHSKEPTRLIYVDEHLLLVRKPDLLLSVPGRHPVNRDCMITRLQTRFEDALIVHRLDLDTSGVMIVARGKPVHAAISALFQKREVDKHYEAWVDGAVLQDEGEIDLHIARDWDNRPLMRICRETGKNALTRYRVLERRERRTRLLLSPHTGRSHQLRIHCREIGHPILGCDMYAPDDVLGRAPRLMLHATRIAFRHPVTGVELVGHSRAPF